MGSRVSPRPAIGAAGHVARRIYRTLRRGSGAPTGPAETGYGRDFRVGWRVASIPGTWPEPPAVGQPAMAADDATVAAPPPRRYDLELFEALNAEYASKPIVPVAPRYDVASIAARARTRLTSIHRRLDLHGKTVLEVGCGSGLEVWYLAQAFGADAWGIDVVPRKSWPVLEGPRVHLVAGDMAGASGLPSAAFDRAISTTVWEHISHPRGALVELHRVLRPGGLAWIRANLYRGPTASHRSRDIHFPFPHLLFTDEVIGEALARAGKARRGASWVNKLTWEQYEAYFEEMGFRIRAAWFDLYPLDEDFYVRFEDVLGRYPRRDLERGFFTAILEKPRR